MMVRLPSFSRMNLPHLKRLAETVGLALVSGSPRRQMILREARIPFDVIVPSVDESPLPGMAPEKVALSLARMKVDSVTRDGRRAYLGCDTIVVLENHILGKPLDDDDALRMLRLLSGRTHSVLTGLSLCDSRLERQFETVVESRVNFKVPTEAELRAYISSGEPRDKAGAYGIQGMGGILVDTVEGGIDNVVGLPIDALEELAGKYWEAYA